jgi:penicillin amidase
VPLLAGLKADDEATERARQALLAWDKVLDKSSVSAGIYEAWYRALVPALVDAVVPAPARGATRGLSTKIVIDWLTAPGGDFGRDPIARRDALLLSSLKGAVADLTQRYGADMSGWAWGRYHQVTLKHPMSAVLSPEMRAKFEVGPWPRGGDGNTPGATGAGENQTAGASFRFIVEAGDWDSAVGTNTPGQSGDVDSPHYRDLFELWKDDRYFPVKYSRPAVEGVTATRTVLSP